MNGLIAQLTGIFGIAEAVIWQAALVFLRVGAAVALLPGFGESFLPAALWVGRGRSCLPLASTPARPMANAAAWSIDKLRLSPYLANPATLVQAGDT